MSTVNKGNRNGKLFVELLKINISEQNKFSIQFYGGKQIEIYWSLSKAEIIDDNDTSLIRIKVFSDGKVLDFLTLVDNIESLIQLSTHVTLEEFQADD